MKYKGFIYQTEKNETTETKGIEVTIFNDEKGKHGCLVISSNNKLLSDDNDISQQVLDYFFKRSVDNFLEKSERSFRKYHYSYEFVLGIHVAFRHHHFSDGADSVTTVL